MDSGRVQKQIKTQLSLLRQKKIWLVNPFDKALEMRNVLWVMDELF